MEIKLVYRVLRKISDWALSGFYSDVYIEGREHVPPEGPFIIVSCHHNEIIDIATLAATIPYRRPLSFWAKSTMFKNPVSRAILLSSGSIPVYRNPNSNSNARASQAATSTPHSAKSLFHSTSVALARGEVIGVFPEGTSYTEPSIVQVKEGAAWAAVEYVQWAKQEQESRIDREETDKRGGSGLTGLMIVPVGIVYTDKSQYQSRVCVKYGEPIPIDEYAPQILSSYSESDRDAAIRAVVKVLTEQIENRMLELTVNASDWDTLFASRIARDLLWGDERRIPLPDFVDVSRTVIGILSPPSIPSASLSSYLHTKRSLLNYYSLLHHTGVTHSSLSAILPLPTPTPTPGVDDTSSLLHESQPDLAAVVDMHAWRAISIFLRTLFITLAHPRFICFIPPLVVSWPSYITAKVGVRLLATPGEEEGVAQYKVIVGGMGMGLGLGVAGGPSLSKLGIMINTLQKVGEYVFCGTGLIGKARKVGGVIGIMYVVGWVLAKWHNALVGGNYRQFKRLVASYKLLAGILSPRSSQISSEDIEPYLTPPRPAVNPFIMRRVDGTGASDIPVLPNDVQPGRCLKPLPSRKLMRHLLAARVEASEALLQYLNASVKDEDIFRKLRHSSY